MSHHHYGLHFHATCWLLKSYWCSHAFDWFFMLVDCWSLEACWTSCNLFLWFYLCVKFFLWLKLVNAKNLHDLILIYFVPNHFFNDLCLFLSFCSCNKMARWWQKLFDKIAQTLEDEVANVLCLLLWCCRYQICNNKQEGNMGDPS
jgi:hypothetical protein